MSSVPVGVVGVSWRTASTEVRARLAALSQSSDSPIHALRQGGYVGGAVCVSTCSRTEWLITGDSPEWAATLLRGALVTRVPELPQEAIHVRAGAAGLHYLLRVAVGLDSVAEGEGAVGRQILKSFETARAAGHTDKRMRLVWKQIERLIHVRRDHVPATRSLGVQSLVREALRESAAKSVAVLGRGEFGLAMERSLKGAGRWDVSTWSRNTLEELLQRMSSLDALVVCTGANHAWLNLPPRKDAGLCIDAGSPPQVRSAPGWTVVGLDELLSRPELHLNEDERDRLEAIVHSSMKELHEALASPAKSATLAAIDAERTAFLNEQLPALLEGLPREQVRRVRQAVGAFTHAILQRTREASS